RAFFTLPTSGPNTVTASRTLPYASSPLYGIIADVDSYTSFLPYCSVSRVTHWTSPSHTSNSTTSSSPLPEGITRRWPTRADLTAGFGGFTETYTSKLFCIPDCGIVEAISGDARTEIPEADLRQETLFKSLVTRWTVRPLPQGQKGSGDWSEVDLSIKFHFANPLHMALSSAVADKVAPVMVEAFIKQAERVLGKPR
ncbi:polyketide cyclase/dehydrase and lipid transporter, partial [Pseudomassariella vexata]